ncbi:threonine synthase [bacterium]|nr:threonine synthase [bacterium]
MQHEVQPSHKKSPRSWYQCSTGCSGHYPLTEIIYRCSKCGDLLEVVHDLEKLRARTPAQWHDLFEESRSPSRGLNSSGVWTKKEWVCPDLKDRHIVSIGEGWTPLFKAQELARQVGLENVWIKLCGNSHTGSFKDLGMTVLVSMVNSMLAEGQPIRAVACASTGDTSAALAAYCAAADIPSVVLLPRNKISTAQMIQPIANCSLTLSLDTDFDGCMALIKKLTESNEIYLANSMNSLRVEGQKTVSMEVVQQLGWQPPDWMIVPGGNLGNVAALGKGLLEMHAVGLIDRLPRLVCAQTQNANPLYESYQKGFEFFVSKKAKPTLATAIQIGNPVSYKKAIRALQKVDGVVEQANEDELANASALADQNGLFTCPQTGVALATLIKLVEKGEIKAKDRVVVISTAHGLKFTSFKVKYHTDRLKGVQPRFANKPIDLPADLAAINRMLEQLTTANTVRK